MNIVIATASERPSASACILCARLRKVQDGVVCLFHAIAGPPSASGCVHTPLTGAQAHALTPASARASPSLSLSPKWHLSRPSRPCVPLLCAGGWLARPSIAHQSSLIAISHVKHGQLLCTRSTAARRTVTVKAVAAPERAGGCLGAQIAACECILGFVTGLDWQGARRPPTTGPKAGSGDEEGQLRRCCLPCLLLHRHR